MTSKQIQALLEDAYQSGDPATIVTEWSVYDDCTVTSVGDTEVEFTAVHPVKDCEYEFRLLLAEIRSVELI